MSERVLVTGASGFVGRPTVAALVGRSAEVHAVARRPSAAGDVQWHACDLLTPGAAAALVDAVRPTHLVHLAWGTPPDTSYESPDHQRWLAAGSELVSSFAAAGGRRAVLAGTCAEYDWGAQSPLREDSPLTPRNAYAAAKDALRRTVAGVPGLSYAWARLFFLYGPHEPRGRLVPSVIDALRRGQAPALTPGLHRRDYVYVDDAASALARLVTSDVSGPVNVGSGRAVPIRDLVLALARAVGRPELIEFGALPAPDEPDVVEADVDRLRSAVGIECRSLADGAAATVQSA